MKTIVAVSLLLACFVFLTIHATVRQSATWDEPQHLTAGYAALTHRDYRIDYEHPPLARMWAALPLALSSRVHFDTGNPWWRNGPQWFFCHDFLYRDNDADTLLNRARFMIALLGVLLGLLLFYWAREWFGVVPAFVVLALYCLEPNLLAHAGLVTTDFGLTCFAFGTVYFLWRLTQHFTAGNAAGTIGFFALALATKFTAVLLLPVVTVLLLLDAWRHRRWKRAAGVFLGILAAGYLAIWAVYGFRYEAKTTPDKFLSEFSADPRIQQASPTLTGITRWITQHRLLPEAYAEGFLLSQAKAQTRGAYLAGNYSATGWWYYFPVAILIKTPLSVLAVACAGIALVVARWRGRAVFALVPVGVFLGAAMAAHINIGLRHVLPIYPFLLLLAGGAVAAVWASRWKAAAVGVLLLAAAELASVYPHCLAAFNWSVGGPSQGDRYLVDSNLDWGQDLKGLKRWMESRGVGHINLSYFGTADPAYYRINCTYLPGSPFFAEPLIRAPQLPGYVAVSVTNLRAVYFGEEGRRFFAPLLAMNPVDSVGHSIRIYWVERPWW